MIATIDQAIELTERSFPIPLGPTLREYVDDLSACGVPVSPGSDGTYWVASRHRVVRRLPTFCTATPDPAEVDRALSGTGALVASYLTEPDEQHAANASLYLCADQGYSLSMRASAMRRNVRRAMRELTIRPVSSTELLTHGTSAFYDTRRRAGLDDGTASGFRRYFRSVGGSDRAGRTYLGAWKDTELAAFVTVLHVDDWAEFSCFSMDSMLRHRPNDALLYVALSHYLAERNCRVVSFGVSSIQTSSNAPGLHRFKSKVGFEPRLVHRAFVLHPSVRRFANRATLNAALCAVNVALQVRPRDGVLKKVEGMLACMRSAGRTRDAARRASTHLEAESACTMNQPFGATAMGALDSYR
jgi:hypothetical protein